MASDITAATSSTSLSYTATQTISVTDANGLGGSVFDDATSGTSGNDTISDFKTGNTGTLSDGDSINNHVIDLSSCYENLAELYADQADDGVLNPSNATDSKGRATKFFLPMTPRPRASTPASSRSRPLARPVLFRRDLRGMAATARGPTHFTAAR